MTWRSVVRTILLSAIVACGASSEGFKVIHIDDLVALERAPDHPVTVLDANHDDFREREGIIPGAVLLSSYNKYDVGKELPPAKDARLVFYCADSH